MIYNVINRITYNVSIEASLQYFSITDVVIYKDLKEIPTISRKNSRKPCPVIFLEHLWPEKLSKNRIFSETKQNSHVREKLQK